MNGNSTRTGQGPTTVTPRSSRTEFSGRAAATLRNGSGKAPANQTRRAYELVRSLIRSGTILSTEQLVEDELVKTFDLPRVSIRQALVQLAGEGLVSRRRHAGTRVIHDYYQIPIDDYLPRPAPSGFMVRQIDLREVKSMPAIRQHLETDDPIVGMVEHLFEHVTSEGSEPIGVRTAYYRRDFSQPKSWATCPSMAAGFEAVYGVPLGRIETILDAAACDIDTALLLQIEPGSTVLMREQVLTDIEGVVQEYTFSHYRADRVSFPLSHDASAGSPGDHWESTRVAAV